MGQGHHAHPGDVCRGSARPRAASRRASTRPAMARLLETYEQVKTQRGVIDFEDVLLLTVGILAERDDIARTVRGAVPPLRRRRVPGRQRPPAAAARPVGGGARRRLRRGRPRADHLLLHRRQPARTCSASPTRHPQAQVVRLVRNYRSTPQIVGLANLVVRGPSRRLMRGHTPSSSRPRASRRPRARADRPPRRPGRGGGIAAEIAERVAAGASPAEIAVLFRTNGQSEAFESALAERDIPYLVRGGERFFARREVRDAILLLRGGGPLRRRRRAPARPRPRRPRRGGLDPGGALERGRGPRAVGVARGAGRPGRRRRGGQPRGASGRLRPRARRARLGPARPGGPGRHAGLAARGQGAGVGHRLPRRLLRRLPADHAWPRHRGGHRGGAAADLRRGHPGPARAAAVLGRGPHPRRPGLAAARRGSSTAPRASSATGARAPRSSGKGAAKGRGTQAGPARELPQLRRRADDRRPAQDRPLRRPARPPTTRRPSSACAPGGWPSRARPACRHTSSSPTPPSRRSPRVSPPREGDLSQISGVGARKLGLYGAQVLQILGGADASQRHRKRFCRNGIRVIAEGFTDFVT